MEKITSYSDLRENDFIKIRLKQNFEFSGQIIKLDKSLNLFEVYTFDGIMGFFWNKDSDYEIHKLQQRPNGWKDFVKNPEPFAEEVLEVKKSKKEQTFDLVKENPKKREAALLKLAKDKIGGDPNLLKTYVKLGIAKFRSA